VKTVKAGKGNALPGIKQYCAYQERCHAEVREKLRSFAITEEMTEEILAQLVEENYLNEERFAIQFAGSKFRMKNWGKVKIKHALKQRQVNEYCIAKAIKAIDENDYLRTLNKLAAQKINSLKGEQNLVVKKKKVQDYLLQKGYEYEMVCKFLVPSF
jgi:regulatory protein